MRQGNGSDVLGPNDPRSQKIGMIYVTANDEHKNVLTAILTQEKVGRERIAVILPAQNKAFQRPADFDGLKSLRKKLHAQVVFVAPSGSPPANFARHRNFTVFSSLEGFTQSLEEGPAAEAEPKPTGFLGGIFKRGEKKSATPPKKSTPSPAPTPEDKNASEPPAGSDRRKSQEINPVVLGGAAAAAGAALASRSPQWDAQQQQPRIVDATPVNPSKATPNRANPINHGPLDYPDFDEVEDTPDLNAGAGPITPLKGRPQPLDFDPAFDDEGDLLAPPTPEQMDEQFGDKGHGLQRAGMMRAEDYETVDMPLEDGEATPRPFSLRRESTPPPRLSKELQEASPARRNTGKTGRGRVSPRDENEEGTGRGASLAGLGAAAAVGGALGAKAASGSRSGAPEPEPIDLSVAPRRRTTVNLKQANPEGAATAAALANKKRPSGKINKNNVNDDPANRPSKRNSGKIVAAGVAGAAAGLAAGEALASTSAAGSKNRNSNTGKTAAVGAGTGAATLPNSGGGGLPPTRGGGGRGSGGGRFQPNQRQKRRGLPWVIVAIVVILLLACSATAYAQPGLRNQVLHAITGQSPATVTITPDSQLVKNDYIVNGVQANPDPARLEVSARQLSATVPSGSRTVNGTGHKQTAGTRSSGVLTFVNGSSNSFTLAGGTSITTNGGHVTVVTDGLVTIPPANLSVGAVGTATVNAHAADPGANGNIGALTINKNCCTAGNSILVKNDNGFSGGQDPQDYTFVTTDEANKVANDLQTQATQSALTKLRGQIQSGEEMASNPQCQPTAPQYSQPVGDTGANVPSTSVSLSVTCTAQVYNRQQLQSLVANKLQDKANTDLGSGYKLVGKIQTRAVQQRQNDKGISWVMEARGLWVYQITNSIEQELARHIAGKHINEAQTILSSTKGIGKVNNIQADGDTLPGDPNQITFTIQNIEGLGDVPPGQGTPTVTAPSTTPQGGKG